MGDLMKSMKRMTVTVQQKIGMIDKTIDKNYEEEARRYKGMAAKSESLYKEARAYLDAIRAYSSVQLRVAEAITNFYDEEALLGLCSLKFKDAAESVDSVHRGAFDNEFRPTVTEPLQKFLLLFPDINEALKRRENLLLDYDELRTKVKKLVDKPSADPTKLPMTETRCNDARQAYEFTNQILIEDLPRLFTARVAYMDPILQAFVRTQNKFYWAAAEAMQPLTKYFTPEVGELTDAEARVNQALQQMRGLSIVRVAPGPPPRPAS